MLALLGPPGRLGCVDLLLSRGASIDAPTAHGGWSAPLVAAFLAGPVRSLLYPAVHRSIRTQFWDAFGGERVVFARLYDVALLDAPGKRALACAIRHVV